MDKWGFSYLTELKTLWEKEKLHITSNFSFSHNVFKSYLLLKSQNECLWSKGLTVPKRQNFGLFQTKEEFTDDHFQFYENGKKFSKRLESTVGKGEIAHYEQFLLFPQYFQKTCTADT